MAFRVEHGGGRKRSSLHRGRGDCDLSSKGRAEWTRFLRAFICIVSALALLVVWRILKGDKPTRLQFCCKRLEHRIWQALLGAFSIDVSVSGMPSPLPGTLFAANHISWTDIVVLGSLLDAGFVAKDDVRLWPVIGPAARQYGCLFVSRERRGTVASQASSVGRWLRGMRSLVLFPEGTTGDGSAVLPFRSSLFGDLQLEESRPVQPVALHYCKPDGTLFDARERRQFAWLDDDALLPSALQLIRSGGVRVEVHFEQPVVDADRKSLARNCRQMIADRLGVAAAHHAATLNRAA